MQQGGTDQRGIQNSGKYGSRNASELFCFAGFGRRPFGTFLAVLEFIASLPFNPSNVLVSRRTTAFAMAGPRFTVTYVSWKNCERGENCRENVPWREGARFFTTAIAMRIRITLLRTLYCTDSVLLRLLESQLRWGLSGIQDGCRLRQQGIPW
jgi:hypothetical protein